MHIRGVVAVGIVRGRQPIVYIRARVWVVRRTCPAPRRAVRLGFFAAFSNLLAFPAFLGSWLCESDAPCRRCPSR
jgi:hypothetical protein